MDVQASLTPITYANTALQSLSEATQEALFENGQVQAFENGGVLYHDGEPAGVVLFPLSGSLQMGKATLRGRRQVICNLEASSCGGICLLMFHDYAPAEARGVEAGQVLVIKRSIFQPLMRHDPALCQLAWQSASNCLAHLSNMVAQLSFSKVSERVARALVEGTDRDGGEVRLTQAELAAEVGTTREVVARCLGDLQAQGSIRLGRARVVVLNRTALRNTY